MNRGSIYDIPPQKMQQLLDQSNSLADVLRKIGFSPYGGDHPTIKRYIEKFKLSVSKMQENRSQRKKEKQVEKANIKNQKSGKPVKKDLEDILSGEISYTNSHRLKQRLLNEGYKEYKCQNCGKTQWMGQPIPLELDHINGDHSDNRLSNLRILCPNCHALTDNYCGKNLTKFKNGESKQAKAKKARQERKAKDLDYYGRTYEERTKSPGREVLKQEIRESSFVSLGKKYGVSDHTIGHWCRHYELPSKRKDINKMSDSDWEKV